METMEFNLLQERWVRVRTQDCTVKEVSLTDALLHAHAYVDLAGEMPTQDAAMLRLQLAVLHTVFSRVDGNGVPAPFEEPRDALQRWGELWQLALPGTADPGLSGQMAGPLLAVPPGAPLLAGAGSEDRQSIRSEKAERRSV